VVVDLHSEDKTAYLRIEVLGVDGGKAYPSAEVRVDLHVEGFAGSNSVRLNYDALAAFLSALEGVERTRRGRAELSPTFPGLRLSISSMDGSGHLLVEFALVRNWFVGPKPKRVDLAVLAASSWTRGRYRASSPASAISCG
jgi:hypothetical protein